MPRLQRFNLIDMPQHVIQRGNNRQACFLDTDDYLFYLECLKQVSSKVGCDIHAYVLMTNHVHLLATPRKDHAVSKLMQSVGRRYVQYINYHYQRTGTLWEGRYKASLVESERYLLTCYRYIELNPVRTEGDITHPGDYRWSSYAANAYGKGDAWLSPHEEYIKLGKTAVERQAAYRGLFANALDTADIHAIRQSVQQGVVLGGGRFRDQIEAAQGIRATPRRRGRPFKERDESVN
jgi:putative transposase